MASQRKLKELIKMKKKFHLAEFNIGSLCGIEPQSLINECLPIRL